MISMSSLKLGHLGSETWSLGKSKDYLAELLPHFNMLQQFFLAPHGLTMENVCDFQFIISMQHAAQGKSQSITSSRTLCEVTPVLRL